MQEQNFTHPQLHYRVYPQLEPMDKKISPPLVLLHGLMGYASNWGKIWPLLSKHRDVLVLDQRGHGKSDKPTAGYAPGDYAGDLCRLIDLLGWDKIDLLGHSMGGRVAICFASLYPDRIRKLVLEDSGAEARSDRIEWIENLLKEIPTPFHDRESAKVFFQNHFTDDPLLGGFLHSNLQAQPDGSFNWRFHPKTMIETIAKGRAKSASEMFSQLKQPTLIIRGGVSAEFPQAEAERMFSARDGVQLEVIAGAGHFVHASHPSEFCRIVESFLSA
jgi:esterase